MRDGLLILAVVGAAALGYGGLHSINGTLARVERQMSKTVILEGMEKCSLQAALVFKNRPLDEWPDAWYENHYSEKLKQCTVMIWAKDKTHKTLLDAFEGRDFAEFLFLSNKVTICDVTLPSREKKRCSSLPDFDELIKVYMQ
jgi:hypothetical protein